LGEVVNDAKSQLGARVRPLSPHLSIHAPLINMAMSILHRLTGAALYVGTLFVAWWLLAAAMGPAEYAYAAGALGSHFGKIALFGYTWALAHHMLGGVRHLIWDTGAGFDLETVNLLSWGTLAGSLALTALLWLLAVPLPIG
jgi:succinate dehydrogenase / fumarate reductase cytochrome b subunit